MDRKLLSYITCILVLISLHTDIFAISTSSKSSLENSKTTAYSDQLKKELLKVVNGINKISVNYPGPLITSGDDWSPLVAGDINTPDSIFVSARKYGKGRIIALGKEDILTTNLNKLDNLKLIKNSMSWLNGEGRKRIGYSYGHGEWVNSNSITGLKNNLAKDKYVVMSTKLTETGLKNIDVLIVGNAWYDFSASEMNEVLKFANKGGGVLLAGLGWSFDHSKGNYPMDALSEKFGVKWGRQVIYDTLGKYNGSPVFNVFFPNIPASMDINGTMYYITQKTDEHPSDLMDVLESDPDFKSEYVNANMSLAKKVIESDVNDASRLNIYSFCKDMVKKYPQYFSKEPTFDIGKYPTISWLRERFINTWISSAELTEARKKEIGSIGRLKGTYLDIWNKASIYIADNNSLDEDQKENLRQTLSLIPPKLHNIGVIAVENYIQADPKDVYYAGFAVNGSNIAQFSLNSGWQLTQTMMQGVKSSVNIYNSKISGPSENPFPSEVAPGVCSIFTGAACHEINHIVDFYYVKGNKTLNARRDQLLHNAGNNANNYLRSMFGGGFFTNNPSEFISSIANQWFTDSAKTIELALKRFDEGYKQPINQALFFADIYSCGSNITYFYNTNGSVNISRTAVSIGRNSKGRINSIIVNGVSYNFNLDENGDVTSYSAGK